MNEINNVPFDTRIFSRRFGTSILLQCRGNYAYHRKAERLHPPHSI